MTNATALHSDFFAVMFTHPAATFSIGLYADKKDADDAVERFLKDVLDRARPKQKLAVEDWTKKFFAATRETKVSDKGSLESAEIGKIRVDILKVKPKTQIYDNWDFDYWQRWDSGNLSPIMRICSTGKLCKYNFKNFLEDDARWLRYHMQKHK